jgi:sodium transport system permease protein
MKNLMVIFGKDLRETVRDKRNVVRMLVLPALLIPLLGHYFMLFADSSRQQLDKNILTYAIAGGEHLPDLVKRYAAEPGLRKVDVAPDKLQEAVSNRQIAFALDIPADAAAQIKKGASSSIKFLYYQAGQNDEVVKNRGTAPLLSYGEDLRDWRLTFLGVVGDEARSNLLHPVSFDADNNAGARERIGHSLGSVIAYPLLIICFLGCSFSAVELVTGEKVKGTLEILVMLPVARSQIVLGKYLVVFLLGLLYATVSMVSLTGWLVFEGTSASDNFKSVLSQIGPLDIFLLWLMLVPVTALFSAVSLAISVHSKSYREAGTLTSLANTFVVIAAMVVFVPGVYLNWLWSLVPVSNVGMVIRELIKGTLSSYLMIASIFSTTLVIGAGLLFFSNFRFQRESIIYRD